MFAVPMMLGSVAASSGGSGGGGASYTGVLTIGSQQGGANVGFYNDSPGSDSFGAIVPNTWDGHEFRNLGFRSTSSRVNLRLDFMDDDGTFLSSLTGVLTVGTQSMTLLNGSADSGKDEMCAYFKAHVGESLSVTFTFSD
jgi:hypothetical protein